MIGGVGLGVALILLGQWRMAQSYPQAWIGAIWGLVAGVSLAGVFLSLRRLARLDTLWVVSLCHLAAAVLLAPFVVGTAWPNTPQFVWLAAFGGVQMGLPYVLFTRGVRSLPAHEAACLALLEPLLVCLWVYLAWGNTPAYRPPDAATLAGGGLILLGLIARYRR
jgi:drug/metabolite transporter (DMT)-like permease